MPIARTAGVSSDPVEREAGGDAWTIAASSPALPEESLERLCVEFGLDLPEGIRAYERGAKGEIARVTFTLTASQSGV